MEYKKESDQSQFNDIAASFLEGEVELRLKDADYRIYDKELAHFMAKLMNYTYKYYMQYKMRHTSTSMKRETINKDKLKLDTPIQVLKKNIVEPMNEKIMRQAQLFDGQYSPSYEQWINDLENGIEGEYTVIPDFIYNYGKFLIEINDPRGIYFLTEYLEHTSDYEQYREQVMQNFMYDDEKIEAYIMPSGEIYDWNALIEYKDFIEEELLEIEECLLQGKGNAVPLPDYKLPVPLHLEAANCHFGNRNAELQNYKYIDYMYLYECYQYSEDGLRTFEIVLPAWAYESYCHHFEPYIHQNEFNYFPVSLSNEWRLEAKYYKANLALRIQKVDVHYCLGTVAYIKMYDEDVESFVSHFRSYVDQYIYEYIADRQVIDPNIEMQLEREFHTSNEHSIFEKWNIHIQEYIRAAMTSYAKQSEQKDLVEDLYFEEVHKKLYNEFVHTYLSRCFPFLFPTSAIKETKKNGGTGSKAKAKRSNEEHEDFITYLEEHHYKQLSKFLIPRLKKIESIIGGHPQSALVEMRSCLELLAERYLLMKNVTVPSKSGLSSMLSYLKNGVIEQYIWERMDNIRLLANSHIHNRGDKRGITYTEVRKQQRSLFKIIRYFMEQ